MKLNFICKVIFGWKFWKILLVSKQSILIKLSYFVDNSFKLETDNFLVVVRTWENKSQNLIEIDDI